MTEQYETKTYDMAMFYIPDGMYTIKELENMVNKFKQVRDIQNMHLKNSLGVLNKAAEDNGEEL